MNDILIPGSESWWKKEGLSNVLERRFPDQDCWDLCIAHEYNDGLTDEELATADEIRCVEFGERDEGSWVWHITTGGVKYVVTGWCDYTGWDCRSGLDVERAS